MNHPTSSPGLALGGAGAEGGGHGAHYSDPQSEQ